MVGHGTPKEAAGNAFAVVGAGYRQYIPVTPRPSFWGRLRGKPLFPMAILSLIVLGCLFAPALANHDPAKLYYEHLNEAPNREFYFGTDYLGRDLFSVLLYGGRTSLAIGFLGAMAMAVFGILYGAFNGIAGERTDRLMLRLVEILGSVPSLLFVLVLSALLPARNILTLSLVIGATGWFGLARIVRSEVRQIRNAEYVLYARAVGGSLPYVTWRHLVPNILSAVLFLLVSNISSCIIMESTLSFLGLGLPIDTLSWGTMLSLADRALLLDTWWVIVIPGLFLLVTLMCVTGVAEWVRGIF